MRCFFAALVLVIALGTPAGAYTREDICQQGQFAEMLADELFEDDPRAASEQGAIDTLSAHGIAPAGGWQAKQPLTCGTMAEVLGRLWASFIPAAPDRPVTIGEAEGMVEFHEEVTRQFLHWYRVHRGMLPLVDQDHPAP